MKQPYKNRKVLIFGLGLNGGGVGMAKYFAKKGAKVTVTDLKTKEELKESIKQLNEYEVNYVLGEHREKDFKENDIIVRNPAVPPNNKYIKIAEENNKKIIIELLYVIKHFPGEIIGVTGTKGKSTTTMLIYEILNQVQDDVSRVFVGGNLRTSTIEILEKAKKNDIAVLEIPSYQLEYIDEIKKSPHIAVITNIYEDHINWHGSKKAYKKAKMNIFKYQTKNDFLVINKDNLNSKDLKTKSKIVGVSLKDKKAEFYFNKSDKNSDISVGYRHACTLHMENSRLKGTHNKYNILQATAAAKIMNIPNETIQKAINNFKGIEGRQEFIREINGVKFYNDTTATNIEAVKAALDTFSKGYSKKIIMIAGGVDKSLDYNKVKDKIEKHLKALVLLEGTASEAIYKTLEHPRSGGALEVHKYYNNFKKAVKKAYSLAEPGDIVILCPGASSFNMFANEFDRGTQFNKIVNQLK